MSAVETPAVLEDPGTALAAGALLAANFAIRIQKWAATSPRALLVDAVQVTPDLGVVVTFGSAMAAAEVAGRLALKGPERARYGSDVLAWEGTLTVSGYVVRVVVEGNLDRPWDVQDLTRPAAFCPRCGIRLGIATLDEVDRVQRLGETFDPDCPWCLTATFRGDR